MEALCNALEAQVHYTKGFAARIISRARQTRTGRFPLHYAKLNASVSQGRGSGIAAVSCSCRKDTNCDVYYLKMKPQKSCQRWQVGKVSWRGSSLPLVLIIRWAFQIHLPDAHEIHCGCWRPAEYFGS